jgi:hypothetical protein
MATHLEDRSHDHHERHEHHDHGDAHGHHEPHDTAHPPAHPDGGLTNEGAPLYRTPEGETDVAQAPHPGHHAEAPPAEAQRHDLPDAVEHGGNAHPMAQEGGSSAPGGDLYRDRELTPPGAGETGGDRSLEKRTVVELRKLAGELKIPNRSRLSKVALIAAIREKQG